MKPLVAAVTALTAGSEREEEQRKKGMNKTPGHDTERESKNAPSQLIIAELFH